MNESEKAHLRAEIRALVAENARALKLAPSAALDLTNRLLAAGALLVGGRVSMPDGSNPIAYAENVYRGDPDAAHLFAHPETPTHIPAKPAAAPKASAKGLSPDARLALANGHEPFRREAR